VSCRDSELTVLDSAVISSRSLRLVDCENVEVVCEDADLRRIEMFRCRGCRVTVIGDDILLHVMYCLTREGCAGNSFCIGDYEPCTHLPPPIVRLREAAIPDSADGSQFFTRVPYPHMIESRALVADGSLTPDGLRLQEELSRFTLPTMFGARDRDLLFAPAAIPTAGDLLAAVAAVEAEPYIVTPDEIEAQYDREREEFVEPEGEVAVKIREVAELLKNSKYCVVYTGAGISTSANIPDFRGPQGAWTLRDKGKRSAGWDLDSTRPTFAHYAITELARRGIVRYVVTTNCDGLHWRTGLPESLIEEFHGSMYKAYCPNCRQFFRFAHEVWGSDFHVTQLLCSFCGTNLLSTGVAFSEGYRSPLEPIVARLNAEHADVALVLGTSMCVQSAAMYPLQVVGKGKLVLVNMQRTPVDDLTDIRIFQKTDEFFQRLMPELGITTIDTTTDVLAKLRQHEDE
jgi:NAD-dependent SIR2 family protein deacetylase